MILYGHPFSSYCQKALIALDLTGQPFEFRQLSFTDTDADRAFADLWPLRRMPLLEHDGRVLREASIIVEYLHRLAGEGSRLLPADPLAALDIRFLDRFFDNYVMTPMQRIVADFMRAPEDRDPLTVGEACRLLDQSYGWLDGHLAETVGPWAGGETFTLADCAAAPSLFYADWVHPVDPRWERTRAYRARLLAHPVVARIVDAARPYRRFFPPGAPDRD